MAAANALCSPEQDSYPKWNSWDVLRWKYWPQAWGGGTPVLTAYKNAWVLHNRERIAQAARQHAISPILLASVSWAEVGGKPDGSKVPVFLHRSFDWSGPDWMDRHLSITKPPQQTSFGAVSIQLRAAAAELQLDAERLTLAQQLRLIECLQTDAFNLDIVARHLRGLILYDYPHADPRHPSEEQFIVAGARYNRGTQRALADILGSLRAAPGSSARAYSEYGRAMLRHRPDIERLLGW